jgi:hypothetical protein
MQQAQQQTRPQPLPKMQRKMQLAQLSISHLMQQGRLLIQQNTQQLLPRMQRQMQLAQPSMPQGRSLLQQSNLQPKQLRQQKQVLMLQRMRRTPHGMQQGMWLA